jgi:hypothetical protein
MNMWLHAPAASLAVGSLVVFYETSWMGTWSMGLGRAGGTESNPAGTNTDGSDAWTIGLAGTIALASGLTTDADGVDPWQPHGQVAPSSGPQSLP